MRRTGRGKQLGWLLGSRCAVKSSQVGALSAQLTPLNLYLHFCTGRSAVDGTVLGQILSKSPLSCSAQSVKAKVQVCQVGLANRDPMQMLPEIQFSTQQDHQRGFGAVAICFWKDTKEIKFESRCLGRVTTSPDCEACPQKTGATGRGFTASTTFLVATVTN